MAKKIRPEDMKPEEIYWVKSKLFSYEFRNGAEMVYIGTSNDQWASFRDAKCRFLQYAPVYSLEVYDINPAEVNHEAKAFTALCIMEYLQDYYWTNPTKDHQYPPGVGDCDDYNGAYELRARIMEIADHMERWLLGQGKPDDFDICEAFGDKCWDFEIVPAVMEKLVGSHDEDGDTGGFIPVLGDPVEYHKIAEIMQEVMEESQETKKLRQRVCGDLRELGVDVKMTVGWDSGEVCVNGMPVDIERLHKMAEKKRASK